MQKCHDVYRTQSLRINDVRNYEGWLKYDKHQLQAGNLMEPLRIKTIFENLAKKNAKYIIEYDKQAFAYRNKVFYMKKIMKWGRNEEDYDYENVDEQPA